MVSWEAVQSSSRIEGGLGAGKEGKRQDRTYWFGSAKDGWFNSGHVFINFALDTRKTLVEGGFRFLTDFTCQVIQSFQDFLFSGEIKGKIVKSLVQIDIWDEDLGGGGGHGNSGWKEGLAINL